MKTEIIERILNMYDCDESTRAKCDLYDLRNEILKLRKIEAAAKEYAKGRHHDDDCVRSPGRIVCVCGFSALEEALEGK